MPFRDHWRDVQCLHDDGIPIDTASNETAKLFDAALTQYTGWYNDQKMGGVESTLMHLIQSDPTCITSRVLAAGMELLTTSLPASSAHAKTLDALGDTTTTNPYVSLHTQALLDWSLGHYFKAAHTWEQILVRYPYDMMAIKFVSDTYFYVGDREMLRDSIARVLPIWEASADRPLKSYLYGMYAFGLGETNMVARAEKEARYGLELNPHDAWATHALAHALEYAGQPWQGIDFLSQTRRDWEQCEFIKPHIDWHEALYELEQGNRESAEECLTAYLASRENQMIMLDFVDIASLIYRLRLSGSTNIPDVPSSHQFKRFLNEHLHDHALFFNDLHIYFVIDDFADDQARADFARSLAEAYDTADTDNARVYRRVGKRLLHAIDAFREKDYARVVDLVYPIRNEIYRVGGSNAQRDVFGLLLLHCAMHSPELEHRLLAKQLINERCWLRNKTKSRMMENYANSILSE